MSKQQRHEELLTMLDAEGERGVEELVERLGVSAMTVRRDLAELAASGQVQRTHGGATLSSAGIAQFRFVRSRDNLLPEKKAIARVAAARIAPGMSVVLDTGTTALEVARELRSIRDLRILTTSLPIAAELHDAPGLELVLLGGTVRRGLPDLTGPLTERNLAEFRVDIAVLGGDAVEPVGIFTNDLSVARVAQAMVKAAKTSILVVDHSKFSCRSFVKYADWEQFDLVVTDSKLPTDVSDWLPATRPELVLA